MYPPLHLSNQMSLNDVKEGVPEKPYLKRMADGDTELILEFYYSPHFMRRNYNGTYPEFNDLMLKRWKQIYEWGIGAPPETDALNNANRATVRDCLFSMVVFDKWSRCKKVYQFDAELELALTDVEKVRVPVRMLDKLPFKSLYIEFAKDGIFSRNFHGAFVSAFPYKNGYLLHFLRVNHDLGTMGGRAVFAVENDDPNAIISVDRKSVDGDHNNDPNGLRLDWEEFCFFVLNALLYLCASNAEIKESEETKKTYKPGKITGKWNDIQKYECGYAYGQAIRLHKKDQDIKRPPVAHLSMKEHKAPRPHPVKASWQHYWVGNGNNKERILKFKAEYFTGGKTRFATISKVRE